MRKLAWLVAALNAGTLFACGGTVREVESAPGGQADARPPTAAVGARSAEAHARPAQEGQGPAPDQLAIYGRDERFAADRQVAELRKAIALYEQFIARAESDPSFDAAVKRSRERIDDAKATLVFLLSENDDAAGAQP